MRNTLNKIQPVKMAKVERYYQRAQIFFNLKTTQIMKTITVNLYSFNELNGEAKKVAIEKLSDINVDYQWWECTYEDAKNIGLKITGFGLDRNRHATGSFLLSASEVAANVLSQHGNECETYKTAENFMNEWQPIFNDYMNEDGENYESHELEDKLNDLESEFLDSLLEDYSIILQNECDYLQSEEAIIQTIEANDYFFTENGKLA